MNLRNKKNKLRLGNSEYEERKNNKNKFLVRCKPFSEENQFSYRGKEEVMQKSWKSKKKHEETTERDEEK